MNREIVDAIESGDNLEAESKFSDIMMNKVGNALEGHRQELASNFVKDTSYETEES
tara:strand:+ start:563 stop:730 length:168 start_codon:yes stop_codon:yes gene_type:complete